MKFLSRLLVYLACASFLIQPSYAQIIPSIPYNLTNGSVADATQVMGNFNTILADVNNNAATSGINTNITSITGLTTPLAPAYGGSNVYTGGTTGGSGNAQTLVTAVPGNFALIIGNLVTGIAGFTNSGATTLSVNASTATAVVKKTSAGLVALAGNEIIAGSSYMWYYDGTSFELLNPSPPANPVTGPGSSVSTDVATFNGTSGVVIQDSGVLVASLVRTVKIQTFTAGGTYTPSAGILYATIECWGGGGAGGGVPSTSLPAGGGGGSGAYSRKTVTAATIGASKAVTIGAGGTGGAGTGGTGGDTSVGSLCIAKGGFGGVGGAASTVVAGGLGGSGASGTGDITASGAPGLIGQGASSASEFSGAGGNSTLGGAGGGLPLGTYAAGNAGAANTGSGGGGALANGTGANGGAGGSGFVVITEYAAQ